MRVSDTPTIRDRPVTREVAPAPFPSLALRALALGAIAGGAFAVGAIAIGAIAIGRLSIGKARIRSLQIDDLTLPPNDDAANPPSPKAGEGDRA